MRTRNTTTRIAALVAGGLAVTVALAGCGGTGSNETSGGGSDSLEVFSYLTSGSEADALAAMIDIFKENYPDITVENGAVSGGGGSNAAQVLQSRIAGNDAPDVWQGHPGAALETYASGALLEDLTPLFDSEGWMDVYPQDVIDSLTVDGKIYGVPFGINQMNVIWWNVAVADQLGVQVGDQLTWDDLQAGVDAATAGGVDPFCLGDKDPFTTGEMNRPGFRSYWVPCLAVARWGDSWSA